MKFRKAEVKDFDLKEEYIIQELKTNRHISACLGSIGLTFILNIDRFKEYLKFKGNLLLLRMIEDDRSLTKKEIRELSEVKK